MNTNKPKENVACISSSECFSLPLQTSFQHHYCLFRMLWHVRASADEGNDVEDMTGHKTRRPALVLSDIRPFLFPIQQAQHHDINSSNMWTLSRYLLGQSIRYSKHRTEISRPSTPIFQHGPQLASEGMRRASNSEHRSFVGRSFTATATTFGAGQSRF